MLSYRYRFSDNVESGLRLRFDATRADYATDFDAGFASTGYHLSFEVYSASNNANHFQALIEYDSVLGTSHASATYELNLGAFKASSTANYIVENDYSRTAVGVRASINLSDSIELKATTAWAEQTIGVKAPESASYF